MAAPARTDNLEQKARALLGNRVTAVRQLAQTRQAVDDARAALEQAEKADAAAQKSGWSTEELRKLGLDAPARRTPGRPRGTSKRTARTDSTAQQEGGPSADSSSGPTGQEPAT